MKERRDNYASAPNRRKDATFFQKMKNALVLGGATTCLFALVVGAIFYRRADDELTKTARELLAETFPTLETSFESIQFDSMRGVRLRSVVWRKPNASEKDEPLLVAEEIYVECPVDLRSIIARKFTPRRVVVTRPQLSFLASPNTLRSDFLSLIPASRDGQKCALEVYDATVVAKLQNDRRVFSGIRVNAVPIYPADDESDEEEIDPDALEDEVELIASPEEQTPRGAEFDDADVSKDDQPVEKDLSPYWQIDAKVSNPYVENLEIAGQASRDRWNFSGEVEKLDVATALQYLEPFAAEKITVLKGAQGKASLKFDVDSSDGSVVNATYRLEGSLSQATLVSNALKYPITDVDAQFKVVNDEFEISRATASCGLTVVKSAYRQIGPPLSPTSAALRVKLENTPLSDEILQSLVVELKNSAPTDSQKLDSLLGIVDDYRFSAHVDVDVALEKSIETQNEWRPKSVVATGDSVECLCKGFPYRFEGLEGRVALEEDGALTIDLKDEKSDHPVAIRGRFDNVLNSPRGRVDIAARNRAVDARLLEALPESTKLELAKLRPSGVMESVAVRIVFDRETRPKDPLRIEAAINLRDASFQYDLFPLPISSISGALYMRDGAWVFSNLTGKTGAATLQASGSLVSGEGYAALGDDFARINSARKAREAGAPAPSINANEDDGPAPARLFTSIPVVAGNPLGAKEWRFLIATTASHFPLGEELRSALVNYDKKEDFEQLRLEGRADAQIRVGYRTDEKKIALQFEAELDPETCVCQPLDLPFAFKELSGRVAYRDGALTIAGLRAKSGRATYSANVASRTDANGAWVVDLTSLRVDQFQIDRDLQSAAPTEGRRFLDFLQPTGYFNADGAIRVSRGSDPTSKRRVAWNLRVVAQQNAARPGAQLDAICGRVRTYGVALEGTAPLVYGEFDLDSFFYKDVQVANLTGPFYYNGNDLFWGREAPPIKKSPVYIDPFVKALVDQDPFYNAIPEARAPANPVVAARSDSSRIFRGQNDPPSGFASSGNAPAAPSTRVNPAPIDASALNASQNAARQYATTQLANGQTEPGTQYASQNGNAAFSSSGNASNNGNLRAVQARVFGGEFISDGIFYGLTTPRYKFNVDLRDAEFSEITRVVSPGAKPLKGRAFVSATLAGEGKNVATLKGSGTSRVVEAELYELPQIVKILQILSVKDPDPNAFSSASVDFQVYGDRVKLDNILLEGDALTLFGDGWLTVRDEEKLVDVGLNARLGNSSTQIPIISDVFGAAGDQLAQIRVEGDLSSPVIQQDRLPGLKKAWWSVFPEQEPTPTDKAPVERSRPLRDAWRKITGSEE